MLLKESKALETSLLEKLDEEKQKKSDLPGGSEVLEFKSLDNEVQTELTKLQMTMKNVYINLEKVKVIRNYWNKKVLMYVRIIVCQSLFEL